MLIDQYPSKPKTKSSAECGGNRAKSYPINTPLIRYYRYVTYEYPMCGQPHASQRSKAISALICCQPRHSWISSIAFFVHLVTQDGAALHAKKQYTQVSSLSCILFADACKKPNWPTGTKSIVYQHYIPIMTITYFDCL